MLVRLRIILASSVYVLSAGYLLAETTLWMCRTAGCHFRQFAFFPAGRVILLSLIICAAVVLMGLFLLLSFKDVGRWMAGMVAVIAIAAAGLRGVDEWGRMRDLAVLGMIAGLVAPQIMVLFYVLGNGFVNDSNSEVVKVAEAALARSSRSDGINAIKLELLGRVFLLMVFWATYGPVWWLPLVVIPMAWQAWDRMFGGKLHVRGASLTEMVRALMIQRRLAGVVTWLIGIAYTSYATYAVGTQIGHWYGWVGGLAGGIVLAQIIGILRPRRQWYERRRHR